MARWARPCSSADDSVVLAITIQDDRISEINAIADPDEIKGFDVEVLST